MISLLGIKDIFSAALREAARQGSPQVEVDHILCGLIAAGGPTAEFLAEAGISLSGVREATHQVTATRLASLGIDAAKLPSLPPPLGTHPDDVGEIPFSASAQALDESLPHRWDEYDLLVACLGEPSGLNAQIVAAAGADPQALAARLGSPTARRRRPRVRRCPVPPDLAAPGLTALTTRHFISAPERLVAQVVVDATHAASWLGHADTIIATDDTIRVRERSKRRRRSYEFEFRRTTPAPAHGVDDRVVWQIWATGRNDSQPSPGSFHDLRLRALDSGTEVELVEGLRSYGRLGRAIQPLSLLMRTWAVGGLLQTLAFACAEKSATCPDS